MWPIIIFLIVLLHLLVGFGFVFFKLRPNKKVESIEGKENKSLHMNLMIKNKKLLN